MAKTPTPAPAADTTTAPAAETTVAPEGAGLDAAPATEPTDPPEGGEPATPPEDGATTPPEDGEAVPPVAELSAYDQAVAFQPDPWDQLPEDPEVRDIYLAINGHLLSFLRRNR